MTVFRLFVLAVACALCLPAAVAAWDRAGAECVVAGSSSEEPGCQDAPPADHAVCLPGVDTVDPDDDETEADSAVLPSVPAGESPVRPATGEACARGLTASLGVSECLFRPPRANA